ncbi:uncharacterized protein LOC132715453 [Ruditapes philippinarum]|uniref:uncharacterized protein LOC132715453 n=1 Tax=Ruditapes philippinarum TaxID=129788 RepID=UPI00295AAA5E|nr:uncharacterized protein LOC132715453 [Ruditapes philippinarum]
MSSERVIYCRDVSEQERIRNRTANGLLLKIYGNKEAGGYNRRDKYGNYMYCNERTDCRIAIEELLCTDILDYVKRKDPRFSGKVHGVGSCFAGVSVLSNEADLLFMLDIEGVLEEDKERPGYAKYRLSDQCLENWKDCVTDDGYLMSKKLSAMFYFYVDDALNSGLHRKLPLLETRFIPTVCLSGLGTIATTLTVTYNNSVIIDVDLVLAINCKGLPSLATATWLKGNAEWPNSEIVSKIKASGYQLVSKAPYTLTDDEQSTMWRISFSLAETMLIQDLDTRIGFSTKLCYGLVRFFNLCFLAPRDRNSKPFMKSYYLKIKWLYECQNTQTK